MVEAVSKPMYTKRKIENKYTSWKPYNTNSVKSHRDSFIGFIGYWIDETKHAVRTFEEENKAEHTLWK